MEALTENTKTANPVEDQPENKKGFILKMDNLIRSGCLSLQRKFDNLSGAGKIIILSMFFICGFCYNLSVIINSIYPENSKISHNINTIPGAVSITTQGDFKDPGKTGLSKKDHLKIVRFLQTLDSLKNSPGGFKEYQRFMRFHPGLLDSIRHVEEVYNMQQIP